MLDTSIGVSVHRPEVTRAVRHGSAEDLITVKVGDHPADVTLFFRHGEDDVVQFVVDLLTNAGIEISPLVMYAPGLDTSYVLT